MVIGAAVVAVLRVQVDDTAYGACVGRRLTLVVLVLELAVLAMFLKFEIESSFSRSRSRIVLILRNQTCFLRQIREDGLAWLRAGRTP